MPCETFHAHGKLLLTSEYFVINGARAIALPVQYGQSMQVKSLDTIKYSTPTLHWIAQDHELNIWVDVLFDIDTLGIIESKTNNHHNVQNILKAARLLNPQFLSNTHNDTQVTTTLTFPQHWGLGSSSTLVSLISDWASVCPFTLLGKTLGGSGYDIACAKATSPIIYCNKSNPPMATPAYFNPSFKNNIYFVYLNKKQDTHQSVAQYNTINAPTKKDIQSIEGIVTQISDEKCNLQQFEHAITTHESIIGGHLAQPPVKADLFPDYWGAIKSLGAWGGDFILCTSNKGDKETFAYFEKRGYNTIFKYNDIILNNQ